MRYRDHRGGFDESMNTVRHFRDVNQLKEHLNTISEMVGKTVAEVRFEYCGHDPRNGWDTFYVLQRFSGETIFAPAGMSDGNFISKPKSKTS